MPTRNELIFGAFFIAAVALAGWHMGGVAWNG